MLRIGESGWIDKERPECGPLDAIVKPLAIAICTSDIHTLWEGAIGDRHNMILGHEACGEVVEVGELVKDFKPGDRVLVPAITPEVSLSLSIILCIKLEPLFSVSDISPPFLFTGFARVVYHIERGTSIGYREFQSFFSASIYVILMPKEAHYESIDYRR